MHVGTILIGALLLSPFNTHMVWFYYTALAVYTVEKIFKHDLVIVKQKKED